MAHRNQFRPRIQSSSRRKKVWTVGPQVFGASATASGSLLWTTGAQPTVEGLTLLRTRGQLVIRSSNQLAVSDGFHGAIGLGISTVSAFDIGVTALPKPITDETWEGWYWLKHFQVLAQTATEADGSNAVSTVMQIEIDSKAMRKKPTTEVVSFGMLEFVEVGTATLNFDAQCRELVALP